MKTTPKSAKSSKVKKPSKPSKAKKPSKASKNPSRVENPSKKPNKPREEFGFVLYDPYNDDGGGGMYYSDHDLLRGFKGMMLGGAEILGDEDVRKMVTELDELNDDEDSNYRGDFSASSNAYKNAVLLDFMRAFGTEYYRGEGAVTAVAYQCGVKFGTGGGGCCDFGMVFLVSDDGEELVFYSQDELFRKYKGVMSEDFLTDDIVKEMAAQLEDSDRVKLGQIPYNTAVLLDYLEQVEENDFVVGQPVSACARVIGLF